MLFDIGGGGAVATGGGDGGVCGCSGDGKSSGCGCSGDGKSIVALVVLLLPCALVPLLYCFACCFICCCGEVDEADGG